MNFQCTFVFIVLTMIKCVLTLENEPLDVDALADDAWRLSIASNNLGFDLLTMMVTPKSKNIVFSPISLSTTLGLLHHGSRGNTVKELENILGYEELNLTRRQASIAFEYLINYQLVTTDPEAYSLDIATALFVNKLLPLNTSYVDEVGKVFLTPLETFDRSSGDLKTVNRINEWVRNKTRNKIVAIIDSLDASEDLIAVNVLYFKSKWQTYFPERNTRNDIFYNGGKLQKSVPMMFREDTYMHYEDEEVAILRMSFTDEDLSMMVFLPHQKDGLLEFEESLSPLKMSKYLYDFTPREVKVKFPKFNISYSTDVTPILIELGATELFQPGLANLSGIVTTDNIAVGELRHKAVIEVNESGVEASGVTYAVTLKSGVFPRDSPTTFTADHPFLFMIFDHRTDLILLMGRVWSL